MPEHQDHSPEAAAEFERARALDKVIEMYLPGDKAFFDELDPEDKVSAVYGHLLAAGEDPDVVLSEFDVFDKEESDEV